MRVSGPWDASGHWFRGRRSEAGRQRISIGVKVMGRGGRSLIETYLPHSAAYYGIPFGRHKKIAFHDAGSLGRISRPGEADCSEDKEVSLLVSKVCLE